MEERSLYFKGWQFPICARCTGILFGQIVAVVLAIFKIRINLIICLIFLALMFLDWFIQYKKIRESTNFRRFITGTLAGFAEINIIVKIVLMIF